MKGVRDGPNPADHSAARIPDLPAKDQQSTGFFRGHTGTKKTALRPPFSQLSRCCLLADMPAAVLATEIGAGLTDKAVALSVALGPAAVTVVVIGVGIGAAERCGGDGACGADRSTGYAGGDVTRPESGLPMASATVIPAVVAAAIGYAALIAAGIGIARAEVLTIGVRVELRAIAGIVDHLQLSARRSL